MVNIKHIIDKCLGKNSYNDELREGYKMCSSCKKFITSEECEKNNGLCKKCKREYENTTRALRGK
jgi:hypothetical protein